jgi:hypothetical protein
MGFQTLENEQDPDRGLRMVDESEMLWKPMRGGL